MERQEKSGHLNPKDEKNSLKEIIISVKANLKRGGEDILKHHWQGMMVTHPRTARVSVPFLQGKVGCDQVRPVYPGPCKREQQKPVPAGTLLLHPPGLPQGSFLGQLCGESAISLWGSFQPMYASISPFSPIWHHEKEKPRTLQEATEEKPKQFYPLWFHSATGHKLKMEDFHILKLRCQPAPSATRRWTSLFGNPHTQPDSTRTPSTSTPWGTGQKQTFTKSQLRARCHVRAMCLLAHYVGAEVCGFMPVKETQACILPKTIWLLVNRTVRVWYHVFMIQSPGVSLYKELVSVKMFLTC